MTKVPRIPNGERIVCSVNGVEETGYFHAKNETGPLSYTTNKKSAQRGLKT